MKESLTDTHEDGARNDRRLTLMLLMPPAITQVFEVYSFDH